jgi:hypothetical protein
MAAAVRPEPLRGPALLIGAPRLDVGRRGLGARPVPRGQPEDGRAMGADLPRAAALPGRGVRVGLGRGRTRHRPAQRVPCHPLDQTRADHPPGRPIAVAEAVPQPAIQPRDRTGRILPHARGLRLDRQLVGRRRQALPASHRRAFPPGGPAKRCGIRCSSAAKSGAATGRTDSHRLARNDGTSRMLRGYARWCGRVRAGAI